MAVEAEEDGITYIDLSDSISRIYGDGRLYIVTIDDVSYRCNSWAWQGECRIGSSHVGYYPEEPIYSEHPEDVPFLIDYFEELEEDWWGGDGGEWGAATVYSGITLVATPGTHTIKIEEVTGSEYVPLDEKFIPNTIMRTADLGLTVDEMKIYATAEATKAATAATATANRYTDYQLTNLQSNFIEVSSAEIDALFTVEEEEIN